MSSNYMQTVVIQDLVQHIPLAEQEKDINLCSGIEHLRNYIGQENIQKFVHSLKEHGNTIWMVNSTATGGGVAEMLPRVMYTFAEFGIKIEWLVINTQEKPFFNLTKKIHNFIHGENPANVPLEFTEQDTELLERINEENFKSAFDPQHPEKGCFHLKKGDIVVIHDPQPSPLILSIRKHFTKEEVPCIWRCHIGLDFETTETKLVWSFLEKYVSKYDSSIFTAKEYIPHFMKFKNASESKNYRGKNISIGVENAKAVIIHPSIHPFDAKNKHLSFYNTITILRNAGLIKPLPGASQYKYLMKLLQPNGEFKVPCDDKSIDFQWLNRPLLTEISRWDRLKGWIPLLQGFIKMKKEKEEIIMQSSKQSDKNELRYLIEQCGLVLAGPAPEFVADDPEGKEVLDEICNTYMKLPQEIQKHVAILCLPCNDRKQNALMVNCLQSISEVVIQNSVREGFGLTLTEAMFKEKCCIASGSACGLRQQLRDEVDGLFIKDAQNPDEVCKTLCHMMELDKEKREMMATNGKKRVADCFLVYKQSKNYAELLEAFSPHNYLKLD